MSWLRIFEKRKKVDSAPPPETRVQGETLDIHLNEAKTSDAAVGGAPVSITSAGQESPVTAQAQAQSQLQSRAAPARRMVERLSDLCTGFSPAKAMSEDNRNKLAELGAVFFRDANQVMLDSSDNTAELQFAAISLFARYLESIWLSERPFACNTHCPEAGQLEYYSRWNSGGTCYDGGCYSDEPDEHCYLVLRRISAKEFLEKKLTEERLMIGDHTIWSYKAILPKADSTEVFLDKQNMLYLKEPMGISGCFAIKRDYR